jgi:quinol monooxygenase YgiN
VRAPWPAILLLGTLGATIAGPSYAAEDELYVVIHVDVAPDPSALNVAAAGSTDAAAATSAVRAAVTDKAVALLRGWAAACSKETGCERFDVLQDVARPNHFSLYEQWRDRAAFDIHEASDTSRGVRDQLQPILASPFDERLHHRVQ